MFSESYENIWILIPIFLAGLLVFVQMRKSRNYPKDEEALDQALASAGYSYDPHQDIFYSRMDAWQKKFGYCRLYDEATAPLSMIVDCEPIRFEYGNKRWLIEIWKGQYGLTTGCEVGIYTSEGPDLNIPGVFNGTFYNCADDEDQLYLSYALRRNRRILFTREGRHWWLTGFKLGEFSEPYELMMDVSITLKDRFMCHAFVNALRETGYSDYEFRVVHTTVWILFDKPHSPQPLSRIEVTDRITQKKNQILCEKYQDLTKEYYGTPQKINAIRQKAPELYNLIVNMGKPIQLFKGYEMIQNHIMQ